MNDKTIIEALANAIEAANWANTSLGDLIGGK